MTNKWICIDGMSQITEWLANAQLSGADRYYEAKQLGREPATSDLQFGRFIQRGEINTMAIYGRVGRDSQNLLAALIGLPVNLYANYLEDKTGSSGFEKALPWGPDVPGKVGLTAVMSSFDFVGRMTYNEYGKLCAGFDPASNLYMARTREDRAMIEIVKEFLDFNIIDLVKLIQSGGMEYLDTIKLALYGKYGTRKTLQIGQLIDLVGIDNVLIVSAEHGLNTIASKVKPEMVVDVAGIDDLRAKWAQLEKFARASDDKSTAKTATAKGAKQQ